MNQETFYAIDFDGTIVTHEFPLIGAIKQKVVDSMRGLRNDPMNVIIIWTCRDGVYLDDMREFLDENDIPYDYINENPLNKQLGMSCKVFAHYYIDDRNMLIGDFVTKY